MLEGAGHNYLSDATEEANAEVMHFLARVARDEKVPVLAK
jgi:hypothetical protein